tara:strand:+ start:408 stop:677 length:270 start_codon:yes stop_codon:yes gene_type:complete
MPECFIVLNSLLGELEAYKCNILYSLFMRPRDPELRETMNEWSLETGNNLYAAVEEYRVVTAADVARVEAVWRIASLLDAKPTELMTGL